MGSCLNRETSNETVNWCKSIKEENQEIKFDRLIWCSFIARFRSHLIHQVTFSPIFESYCDTTNSALAMNQFTSTRFRFHESVYNAQQSQFNNTFISVWHSRKFQSSSLFDTNTSNTWAAGTGGFASSRGSTTARRAPTLQGR